MSKGTIIAIVAVLVVFVLIFLGLAFWGTKSKKERTILARKLNKKVYHFLARNFLTAGSCRATMSKVQRLSVYNTSEAESVTVKYFLISWTIAVGVILFGIFSFQDIISILLCGIFGLLLQHILVEKALDKSYKKILESMSMLLSNVRQEYMRTGSIVDSLSEAEIPPMLRLAVDDIYNILTANDGDVLLEKFYAATPYRLLQTLCGVCYTIENQGDTKDILGASNFVNALNILAEEVNGELTKLTLQNIEFRFLEYAPVFAVFCIPIIEGVFGSSIPGTTLIYNGTLGLVIKVLVFVSTIAGFYVVNSLASPTPVKANDQVDWAVIALYSPLVEGFVKGLIPKNKKRLKLERKFVNALSRQSLEEFYLQKIVYGTVVLVVSVFALFAFLQMAYDYTYNATQSFSISDSAGANYTHQQLMNMDEKYLEQRMAMIPEVTLQDELLEVVAKTRGFLHIGPAVEPEVIPDLSDEAMTALVTGYLPGLSDLDAGDQVSRLRSKFDALYKCHFQWWMLFICMFCGLLGYLIPNMALVLRKMLIKTETQEDFLQLQTLASIFMNTNMDTLDILYEMSRQSRVHSDVLTYCYHAYVSNPELELARLSSRVSLPEFKRFINKLKLTSSDLSMAEAFSDLTIERAHVQEIKGITARAMIYKKKGYAKIVAFAPLVFVVVGEFALPIIILGINEFGNAMGGIQNL